MQILCVYESHQMFEGTGGIDDLGIHRRFLSAAVLSGHVSNG
jgi:hypothetical protein